MHDPLEARARATAMSVELDTPMAPGFEALAYKAPGAEEDTGIGLVVTKRLVNLNGPREVRQGLEAGFFNHLTKPIEGNQLMDALDAALKRPQSTNGPATIHQEFA
jgi:CheY-like chemotaxis protein